ncbi:MAG: prepilin-type N-terminal cleavage/methylation domain-containing protein [Kiritimatiellae bacterium]|nr:prepilin-type N-terminal cleavage/methylation domain-containing protein [Kiritimatiellia bacterium]
MKAKKRAGFTLIELLIVISIIAIVATLAIGAAVKAIHQGKVKRVAATATTLQMAIMNYRAQRGNWPFIRPGGKSDGDFAHASSGTEVRTIKGGKDSKAGDVWAKLYKNGYIDGSGIMCYHNGSVKTLNTVSRREANDGLQIGFRDPDESSRFRYYNIQFNLATESVHVTY